MLEVTERRPKRIQLGDSEPQTRTTTIITREEELRVLPGS